MANSSKWAMANWQTGKVTFFQALGSTKLASAVKYPKLTASLPGQAGTVQQTTGTGGSNAPATGNISTGGKSGIVGLYNALKSAGATQNQAIAAIANAMAESSLDPESVGDGGTSFGLWQFHEPGYPNASSLVTGNRAADLTRQVRYLVQVGGLNAATGTSPQQAAGNMAANFERCTTCQPGQASYNTRVANVSQVLSALGM